MTIPKHIKAFGITWELLLLPVEVALGNTYTGRTEHQELKVSIALGKDYLMRKTALHELIHVADEHAKIDLTEVQVVRLENSLFALIQDNQELFKWILFGDTRL